MLSIHFSPDDAPAANLELQRRLMALLTRSAAMGVLPDEELGRLDAAGIRRVIRALQQQKLLAASTVNLAPLLRDGPAKLDAATAAKMARALDDIVDVLDDSPVPATEWATMREVFGDEPLSRLLGVSEVSLRRYASAARATPQDVAERLHWLAMVVAALAGAYNAFGIRRWFERARSQLDGRSPRQVLGARWHPDSAAARRIRELAETLSGARPGAA